MEIKTKPSLRLFLFLCTVVLGFSFAGCQPSPTDAADVDQAADDEIVATMPLLQVGAVYNEEFIQIRLRFATDNPSWYHQYWVFDGEDWQRMGSGDGRDRDGLYEDRISLLWDDGSVAGFEQMGGFITVHPGVTSTRSEASQQEVKDHPILGQQLGLDEITKFIPQSRRTSEGSALRWQDVLSLEELHELRQQGVFLDLWQWRAHRSNPVGYADNGYVLEARHSSEGRSMFFTNRDAERNQPAWMFNPDITGKRSLRLEALREQSYGLDDRYYLLQEEAVAFDPEHNWQAGDAIPHRVLREPDGSRGAIRAHGSYRDGAWEVRLTRSLASPNPLDSKALLAGEIYHVAFAVHQASGALHHLVSTPRSFGLGVESEITAQEVGGELDDHPVAWVDIPLFDPGDPTSSVEP